DLVRTAVVADEGELLLLRRPVQPGGDDRLLGGQHVRGDLAQPVPRRLAGGEHGLDVVSHGFLLPVPVLLPGGTCRENRNACDPSASTGVTSRAGRADACQHEHLALGTYEGSPVLSGSPARLAGLSTSPGD